MILPNKRNLLISIAVVVATLPGFLVASGAPLNYNADTTVSLTSPAAVFTIASGSVADKLIVNASSVIVTLSSSTGGTFTLTATSTDFTIASSTGGGTALYGCVAGLASTTISQQTGSASYTISPTASACIPAILVSNVQANPSYTTAVITWTTNFLANSTVNYGATSAYGSAVTDPTLTTSHSITLSGLSVQTTYHFDVVSAAPSSTTGTSADTVFTTFPAVVGVGGGSPPPAPPAPPPSPTPTPQARSTSWPSSVDCLPKCARFR